MLSMGIIEPGMVEPSGIDSPMGSVSRDERAAVESGPPPAGDGDGVDSGVPLALLYNKACGGSVRGYGGKGFPHIDKGVLQHTPTPTPKGTPYITYL